MPLTLAEMATLINDNTTGEIVPADHRAVNEALVRRELAPQSIVDPDDIWWDGDVAAFTEINISGTQDLVEQDNQLSVKWWGLTDDHIGGLLKAESLSTGDAWAVPVSLQGQASHHIFAGILIAAGTGTTAAALMATIRQIGADPTPYVGARRGVLNLANTSSEVPFGVVHGKAWLKLTYVAANTFRSEVSPDGIHWAAYQADISFTLTPTHIGVGWSWGGTTEATGSVATFGPLCKVA